MNEKTTFNLEHAINIFETMNSIIAEKYEIEIKTEVSKIEVN